MENVRRKVKREAVCPHCGGEISRAAPSVRAVFKGIILEALAEGPASVKVLSERMGVRGESSTLLTILRIFEHQKLVRVASCTQGRVGRRNIVWELERGVQP